MPVAVETAGAEWRLLYGWPRLDVAHSAVHQSIETLVESVALAFERVIPGQERTRGS